MKKMPLTAQFLLNSFFTAIAINTIVISAHILTARDFSYSESLNIVLISLGVSAALFAIVCIALSLIATFLKKTGKEKRFWILMVIGIAGTAILFLGFDQLFANYSDEPGIIAPISAFSMLVSLTAQYELLTDESFKGVFNIESEEENL